MLKNIKYLIRKIITIIKINVFLRRKMLAAGILLPSNDIVKNINRVVFDLSDTEYCHIGDCLFYEPILKLFEKNNFNTAVIPHQAMTEYFKYTGHKIESLSHLEDYSFNITPIWRIDKIQKKLKDRTIFINYNDHKINEPVSLYIGHQVSKMFGFPLESNEFFIPSLPVVKKIFSEIKDNYNYYILSINVDSGSMRISESRVNKLISFANQKIREGNKILYVGTQEDKLNSKINLPFKCIDMRGKTSVLDLFSICSKDNIHGTISFDTAIAHIGLLYNKEVNIKMRIFSNSHSKFVKSNIFPSYKSINKLNINYI